MENNITEETINFFVVIIVLKYEKNEKNSEIIRKYKIKIKTMVLLFK